MHTWESEARNSLMRKRQGDTGAISSLAVFNFSLMMRSVTNNLTSSTSEHTEIRRRF